MRQELKIQLKKLDKEEISIENFVAQIREIANQPENKTFTKEEVIKEYLQNILIEKQKTHKENNLKSYKKWLSNPENKKKRSERDKARYLLNKEKAKKNEKK